MRWTTGRTIAWIPLATAVASLLVGVGFVFPAPLAAQSVREASRDGDAEAVRSALASDAGAALETDGDGRTPLHHAASRGYLEIAILLIDAGADVNATDEDGERPIHRAVRYDEDQVVELLLERGAEVDARNGYGRTPLLLVARETGSVPMAGLLLDTGADANARDRFDDPPIHLAAWRGFEDLVNLFLDAGTTLPPPDSRENAVLVMFAAEKGLDRLFEGCAVEGVDLTDRNDNDGSLLHSAAQGGSSDIVGRLIDLGLEVNESDRYGRTPLHYAGELGREEVIEALVALGADLNPRSVAGETPYNTAVGTGRSAAAKRLADLGADTSVRHFPELRGPYLGQEPPEPGAPPALFAPDIVSTHRFQHGTVTFSPDGTEAFWATQLALEDTGYSEGAIVRSHIEDGLWTEPALAGFSRLGLGDDVPFFAPDGERLYFLSSRPGPGDDGEGPERIWHVDRIQSGWSEPVLIPGGPNSLELHWQFSVAADGSIYSPGEGDLYVSRLVDGTWGAPERLPAAVNSEADEFAPYVTPGQDVLLFTRAGHPDNRGYVDLWASFRGPDGSWSEAVHLPEPVNTRGPEICPILSPDGRYVFLNSGRAGNDDNYWVDAGFLEELYPDRR
jgi:ankyrin repeat protein